MGIEIHSNMGDAFGHFERLAVDAMQEEMAQGLAAQARTLGLESTAQIDLEIESDTEDPAYALDADWIRARADEILKE